MIIEFIENIGNKTIQYFVKGSDFIIFIFRCFFYILQPKSYSRHLKVLLVKQLYSTTIAILPFFILLSLFLGPLFMVIAISFSINFNITEQIGALLVAFVINEFAPIFTTFFIILYYALYIFSNIVSQNTRQNRLYKNIYMPRILNGMISLPSMSLLFATIMLISGFVVSAIYLNIDFETYKQMILDAIQVKNIFILILKSMVFGFMITVIPIYYAHNAQRTNLNLTKYLINILTAILITVSIIEILAFLIIY